MDDQTLMCQIDKILEKAEKSKVGFPKVDEMRTVIRLMFLFIYIPHHRLKRVNWKNIPKNWPDSMRKDFMDPNNKQNDKKPTQEAILPMFKILKGMYYEKKLKDGPEQPSQSINYEELEELLRKIKNIIQQDPSRSQAFEELCESFKRTPDTQEVPKVPTTVDEEKTEIFMVDLQAESLPTALNETIQQAGPCSSLTLSNEGLSDATVIGPIFLCDKDIQLHSVSNVEKSYTLPYDDTQGAALPVLNVNDIQRTFQDLGIEIPVVSDSDGEEIATKFSESAVKYKSTELHESGGEEDSTELSSSKGDDKSTELPKSGGEDNSSELEYGGEDDSTHFHETGGEEITSKAKSVFENVLPYGIDPLISGLESPSKKTVSVHSIVPQNGDNAWICGSENQLGPHCKKRRVSLHCDRNTRSFPTEDSGAPKYSDLMNVGSIMEGLEEYMPKNLKPFDFSMDMTSSTDLII